MQFDRGATVRKADPTLRKAVNFVYLISYHFGQTSSDNGDYCFQDLLHLTFMP